MTHGDITVLGQTNFRGVKRPFGIYADDRRRHVYIVGKTGVGKTTFMQNMITQDIEAGRGVGLVDPHGDLATSLLNVIPPRRVNDVIYFDPADIDYPIAFNFLEAVDPQYKYLIASGLVSSLKKIWADSWGPRLEYILRNTILALLDYPSSTMLGILRMLGDKEYRKKVIKQINDPVIKSFWINEFANYNERFRSEAISPIQNKVGQFLTSSIIRNIVAQPKSTIDMKDVMDNGKILIINVSKGRIGEDNSALLGAMMITRLQLAAMDRSKTSEEQRRDFYLYVDEFQNFATESFATIFSEARKYRLNLTVAHQYITQMEEPVRDAVFGNAGTLVSFRVGAVDAEFLETEFAPVFMQQDLVNLDKYNAYIKLMINGITSKPFSMQTIPPSGVSYDRAEIVTQVSRERYGRRREIVEEKIARWSGVVFKGTAEEEGQYVPSTVAHQEHGASVLGKLPPPEDAERELPDIVTVQPAKQIVNLEALLAPSQQAHTITCARCGKQADVPFLPQPGKPAYCRECFKIVRQEKKREQLQLSPHTATNSLTTRLPASQQHILRQPPSFSGPKPPPLP